MRDARQPNFYIAHYMNKYAVCTVYGLACGILGGCFGFGPSFGMPGLYFLGIVTTIKKAIGTISISSPAAYGAAYKYYLNHVIDLKAGIIYAVCFFAFAPIGAILNKRLSDKHIFLSMAIVHCLSSMIFLYLYWT